MFQYWTCPFRAENFFLEHSQGLIEKGLLNSLGDILIVSSSKLSYIVTTNHTSFSMMM